MGESLENFLEEVLGGLRNVEGVRRSPGVSAETPCAGCLGQDPGAVLFSVDRVSMKLEGKALFAAVGWASANHSWLSELQLGDRINCGYCRDAYRELLPRLGSPRGYSLLIFDLSTFNMSAHSSGSLHQSQAVTIHRHLRTSTLLRSGRVQGLGFPWLLSCPNPCVGRPPSLWVWHSL